jgi:hypothetical protein
LKKNRTFITCDLIKHPKKFLACDLIKQSKKFLECVYGVGAGGLMAMSIPPTKKDKSYTNTSKMGRKLCIGDGSPKALPCFEVPRHKSSSMNAGH